MARRTGSRAHERFTGPQILKLRREQPEVYEKTEMIRCVRALKWAEGRADPSPTYNSLVSSFLTTLFCADGEIKPMEESDACGMNLWGEYSGSYRGFQLLFL